MTEKDIRDALKNAPSVTAAAKTLGISRQHLHRLMVKYGVKVERIVT